MSIIRVITAVRYNKQKHVQYVRWGLADTRINRWKVRPAESHVIHVLEALKYGEDVWTIFPDGEKIVPGPRVEVVKIRRGLKTIATMQSDTDNASHVLEQLPRF